MTLCCIVYWLYFWVYACLCAPCALSIPAFLLLHACPSIVFAVCVLTLFGVTPSNTCCCRFVSLDVLKGLLAAGRLVSACICFCMHLFLYVSVSVCIYICIYLFLYASMGVLYSNTASRMPCMHTIRQWSKVLSLHIIMFIAVAALLWLPLDRIYRLLPHMLSALFVEENFLFVESKLPLCSVLCCRCWVHDSTASASNASSRPMQRAFSVACGVVWYDAVLHTLLC